MTFPYFTRRIPVELSAVLILWSLYLLIAWQLDEFRFLDKDRTLRSAPIIVGLFAALTAYSLARIFFTRWFSVATVFLATFLLSYINHIKHGLTARPLTWGEVTAFNNHSVITSYVGTTQIVVASSIILFALWLMHKYRPWQRPNPWAIGILVFLLPIVFHPYVIRFSTSFGYGLEHWVNGHGLQYINWDLEENVRRNGLLMHLVHTSVRSLPSRASDNEADLFHELSLQTFPLGERKRPQTIVWILCEACWHDENLFKEEFAAFEPLGFRHFEQISPVYGGSTVNASFELLTGLPSSGVLDGVIYQEYEPHLRKDISSYVQSLRAAGYTTVAMHNHRADFWNRDLVKPKMGFDYFFGLEEMPQGESFGGWSRDYVLYDAALDWLSNADHEYRFMFLVGVFPHGGYVQRRDYGVSSYLDKLRLALQDLAVFLESLLEENPDALVVFIGDHKPSLTRFFHVKGVFGDDLFIKTGRRDWHYRFAPDANQTTIGRVPAYIYYQNEAQVQSFVENADSLPFFCFPVVFNESFTGVSNGVLGYSASNDRCKRNENPEGEDIYGGLRYPEFLYSLTLFEDSFR